MNDNINNIMKYIIKSNIRKHEYLLVSTSAYIANFFLYYNAYLYNICLYYYLFLYFLPYLLIRLIVGPMFWQSGPKVS